MHVNNTFAASSPLATTDPPGIVSPFATTMQNITSLSVSGVASTNIRPDIVKFSLGVQTTNKSANGAILENARLMNKVVLVLKSMGVKENETGTSSFNFSPIYSQTPDRRGNITGFTATNFITVRSFNITAVPKWIDQSINMGANSISGINFSVSDKKLSQIKNILINEAIDDAKMKANNIALKLGLKVQGIKSLNIDTYMPDLTSPRILVAQGLSTSGGPFSTTGNSPIISGEQQLIQRVDIGFVLAK